jgi:glycosyltransferase involved in cell wall biosynthesis
MNVALVHDWLTGMRGGEKCLEVLCELYPDAPIYTLLHNKGAMSPLIESKRIVTSFINSLPKKETKYRSYLPLFPTAIELFDFSEYDLVISTSHAVVKGAKVRKDALHICYCHTPMRYVWELYDEYFGKGKAGIVTRTAMKMVRPYLQRWDVKTANRVHYYIANSENVRERIQRYYNRDAEVIFPPVDTERFALSTKEGGYYLMVTALVPYKRVDLAIHLFNSLGEKLLIVGKGTETEKLKSIAKPNIEFLGWCSDEQLAQLYAGCKALIFPGEEDFGIVPLEAMACGKPVIAYGKGGALETVIDGKTGVFFYEQTIDMLKQAIQKAEVTNFNPHHIREHALRFSRPIYKQKMKDFIESKTRQHILAKELTFTQAGEIR